MFSVVSVCSQSEYPLMHWNRQEGDPCPFSLEEGSVRKEANVCGHEFTVPKACCESEWLLPR